MYPQLKSPLFIYNKSDYRTSFCVNSQRRSDRQTDSSCLLSGMAAETETKQDENFIRCGAAVECFILYLNFMNIDCFDFWLVSCSYQCSDLPFGF